MKDTPKKEFVHLTYSLYASSDYGVKVHPQQKMKDLGITYQVATPQTISDSWWFWNCEDVPKPLPKFLRELKADPMKCIGYGLSEREAEAIRDYPRVKKYV